MPAKSIKKNYIYNLLQQILAIATPLVTIPYVSRVLGAEGIGIYSYTNSIAFYFTLFAALGTVTYGQREISYVQDDKEKRTQVFWNTEIRCIITTLICLIVYGVFVFFQKQNQFIYFILSISIIEVAVNITWLFMGMEEFGKIVKCNILVRILNLIFIFTFVKKATDLPVYVFGQTITMTIGFLCLWPYLPKFVGKPKLKDLHPFKDFKVVVSMFIPTIAISIYTVLDKTMIGVLTNDAAENGFYEQAMKISKIALTFVTALGVVMVPRIGTLFAKNEQKQIQHYMYQSYRFVCFLGIPACLGIIGISSNFVPWFFGAGFDRVIPVLNTLSFVIVVIAISNVTGVQYLVPTKRQNLLTLSVLVGAVINFICNLIAIPRYGAIGAAFVSIGAETAVTVTQLVIVRKEISFWKILGNSVKYVLAGLVMFASLCFLKHHLINSIASTVILISAGSVIYIAMLFILRDDFWLDNVNKLKKRLLKKQ